MRIAHTGAGTFGETHLDGLTCMVGHTRRFNPSLQYVHNRIVAGELVLQQMVLDCYRVLGDLERKLEAAR